MQMAHRGAAGAAHRELLQRFIQRDFFSAHATSFARWLLVTQSAAIQRIRV